MANNLLHQHGLWSSRFAHTNGYGDFVLFDDLGHPWPVHECYDLQFFYSYERDPDIGADGGFPKRRSLL